MTDTTKTDDKIKPRTIVGSHPLRYALPEGREALERALARALPTCKLSSLARRQERCRQGATLARAALASWLPERYRNMSEAALRDELRRLDEVAP